MPAYVWITTKAKSKTVSELVRNAVLSLENSLPILREISHKDNAEIVSLRAKCVFIFKNAGGGSCVMPHMGEELII